MIDYINNKENNIGKCREEQKETIQLTKKINNELYRNQCRDEQSLKLVEFIKNFREEQKTEIFIQKERAVKNLAKAHRECREVNKEIVTRKLSSIIQGKIKN